MFESLFVLVHVLYNIMLLISWLDGPIMELVGRQQWNWSFRSILSWKMHSFSSTLHSTILISLINITSHTHTRLVNSSKYIIKNHRYLNMNICIYSRIFFFIFLDEPIFYIAESKPFKPKYLPFIHFDQNFFCNKNVYATLTF